MNEAKYAAATNQSGRQEDEKEPMKTASMAKPKGKTGRARRRKGNIYVFY